LSKTHRNAVSVGFKFTRFVKKNWWGLKTRGRFGTGKGKGKAKQGGSEI
jgi:hypothetical protein